jgi:hypothetical protein
MIAVKRLQSLFWVLLVALGALGAYMVNLKVATERNELNRVRAQIASLRGDIRYLETEFSARANLRQLEKWNAEQFKYAAPTADSYLDGERALAHLDGIQPNGPSYVAPPVMVAMVDSDADLPAAAADQASSPDAAQIRSEDKVIRTAQVAAESRERADGPARRGEMAAASAPRLKLPTAATASMNGGGKLARRAERMAMLDARLLDDGMINELRRKFGDDRVGGR